MSNVLGVVERLFGDARRVTDAVALLLLAGLRRPGVMTGIRAAH